jgi:hypothetical protein
MLLIVFLACVIGLSTTLAHASPPDPTWIAGIYDAGDFDEVVWILAELCVSDQPPVSDQTDEPRACRPVTSAISHDEPSIVAHAVLPRSPPLLDLRS